MMTRRTVIFTDKAGKTYATPEFNGDKSEFEYRDTVSSTDWCDENWDIILKVFDGIETLEQFTEANKKAQNYYHSFLGSEILPVKEIDIISKITSDYTHCAGNCRVSRRKFSQFRAQCGIYIMNFQQRHVLTLNRLIENCNNLIREYNTKKILIYPHWLDNILIPLAREIGLCLNMQYKVSGVYGLKFECYVTVFDDKKSYILGTTPKFKESLYGATSEIDCLCYDTGEDKKPYDLNGFGRKTERLPDNIDEIIKIMKERE